MIFQKLLNFSLILFIFFLPLIPPFFSRGYEEIKVLGLLYGMIIIGVIFFINHLIQNQKIKISKVQICSAIFLLMLLITSIAGVNIEQSILGGPPYFQGWITFLFLFLLSFVISLSNLSNTKILFSLISSAGIVSIIALIQYLNLQIGVETSTYSGRVVSTFGQPNFYAGFLLLILPFMLARLKQAKKNELIFLLVSLAVILLAIAISYSRTAIILTALVISCWMIITLVKTNAIRIGLFVMLVMGLFYALIPSRILHDELLQPLTRNTVEMGNIQKRAYIWQVGFEQFLKKPVLGYGLENIAEVYPNTFDFNHPKPAFYHVIKDLNIDNTHNLFLNLLLWGGVVTLIIFLPFVVILFKSAASNELRTFIVLFLCWSFFQNLSIIHWLLFFLVIGLIDRKKENKNRPIY